MLYLLALKSLLKVMYWTEICCFFVNQVVSVRLLNGRYWHLEQFFNRGANRYLHRVSSVPVSSPRFQLSENTKRLCSTRGAGVWCIRRICLTKIPRNNIIRNRVSHAYRREHGSYLSNLDMVMPAAMSLCNWTGIRAGGEVGFTRLLLKIHSSYLMR